MREKHYKNELLPFVNGELSKTKRQVIGEHVIHCKSCRSEHDEIKFGMELAKRLKRTDAPNRVWKNIEEELNGNHQAGNFDNLRIGTRRLVLAFASIIALVGATSILYFFVFSGSEITREISNGKSFSAWQVKNLSGKSEITNTKENGSLNIGSTLETDSKSTATIEVPDIGQVKIAPNSLVKLVNSSKTEHRLSLERGTLEAQIFAPPRLFVVDTPSASAVDLGCAYKLEVDEEGNSKLSVSSGYVALEREGRESFVPAGAMCLTKRNIGVGTPFFESASKQFRKALQGFDFEKKKESYLKTILLHAKVEDTLTLWHLLTRVAKSDREKVFRKMIALSEIPAGVTQEGVLRLDKNMLEKWKHELEILW